MLHMMTYLARRAPHGVAVRMAHPSWALLLRLAVVGVLLSLLLGPAPARPAHAEPNVTFTVNVASDNPDANTGDGVCRTRFNRCSLRAAIQQANATPGLDIIIFRIATGVVTISVGTALPPITDPVVIDGTSAPGFAGSPIVVLSGSFAGPFDTGLTILGGGSTVTGLVIHNFATGILLFNGGGNVIQANRIGTDVSGTLARPNRFYGVHILGSSNNTVGGTVPALGNLISGNGRGGVLIERSSASGNRVMHNRIGTNASTSATLRNGEAGVRIVDGGNNVIGPGNIISGNDVGVHVTGRLATGNWVRGNRIGTDATGFRARPNRTSGVLIQSPGNLVGGGVTADHNIISGNLGSGVVVGGINATGNRVVGNLIGTGANGTTAVPNGIHGILVTAVGNAIGLPPPARPNTIAFNRGDGVYVASGSGNTIRSNRIFGNLGLGIDLGPDGATPNDPGDGDTGANNLQNFPVVTSVQRGSSFVVIAGRLDSAPNTAYTLEFFVGSACDISGHGEGQRLLATRSVTTDGTGRATFGVVRFTVVSSGQMVTATATDPAGNTSEFSACEVVPVSSVDDGEQQDESSDTAPALGESDQQ